MTVCAPSQDLTTVHIPVQYMYVPSYTAAPIVMWELHPPGRRGGRLILAESALSFDSSNCNWLRVRRVRLALDESPDHVDGSARLIVRRDVPCKHHER